MTKDERNALSDALTSWRLFCALKYDNFYNHYDRIVQHHYYATWRNEKGN